VLIVFLVKTEKLPLSADELQNDFNNERTRRKCILQIIAHPLRRRVHDLLNRCLAGHTMNTRESARRRLSA
jgi:hypothetical protein